MRVAHQVEDGAEGALAGEDDRDPAERGEGVLGIVLRDDGGVRLCVRRDLAVGGDVAEGVAPEARIVAALRAAGYRFPAVRSTIDAIRRSASLDDPERSLGQRIEALAQRTLALLEAGADTAALLRERV